MKKPRKNKDYNSLKKDYIRLEIEFLIMFAIFLAFIFFNYNYLMYKTTMSLAYIDSEAMNEVFAEVLEEDFEKDNFYLEFDNAAIKLLNDKITDKNEDEFTYFFQKGEYEDMNEQIKEEAKKSEAKKLDDGVSYLKLTNFSTHSLRIMKKGLEGLKEDKIIIDLRGNTGGTINIACTCAQYFLDKGDTICTVDARSRLLQSHKTAKKNKPLSYDKIIILQDEYTASASEIFINSLKENLDNVTIIGDTSYGKGIGQAEFRLTRGYAFKATILSFETPKGNSINKKGIVPDIFYTKEDILDYATSL